MDVIDVKLHEQHTEEETDIKEEEKDQSTFALREKRTTEERIQ